MPRRLGEVGPSITASRSPTGPGISSGPTRCPTSANGYVLVLFFVVSLFALRPEIDDLLAVVDWVRDGFGQNVTIWLGGFSFGAGVALRAAAPVDPAQLITIAPAVRPELTTNFSQPACPWLVAIGDDDELVDCEAVINWLNTLEPGPGLIVFEGGDHFFHGRLVELRENLVSALGDQAARIPLQDAEHDA